MKNKQFFKGMFAGVALSAVLSAAVLTGGCNVGPTTSDLANILKQKVDTSERTEDLENKYSEIENKLSNLQQIVDAYYLNDEEIDTDAMIEGIYKGYIDALKEPYTVYYTSDEYNQLMESTSGKYSGIGVVVTKNMETGVISVVRPFKNSPGEEAGLLKDDVIYKIEDKEVTGGDLNEIVSWIKGEEGTTVKIEIYRPSEDKYITFNVERKTIEVPMVEYKMMEDNIGYVALYEFEETTSDQFNAAIDDLLSQGMKGLVLDLRDNPGGLVDSAVNVLDRILPKDKLVVYTIDKNGEKSEEYTSDNDKLDMPIEVLINGNSASASEIVSGCLQDYGVAELVGTTSFGKGIVQYILPLKDGSAVKLTCAKYYTPKDRNIHGIGIEPDVTVDLDKETENDEQLEKAHDLIIQKLGK